MIPLSEGPIRVALYLDMSGRDEAFFREAPEVVERYKGAVADKFRLMGREVERGSGMVPEADRELFRYPLLVQMETDSGKYAPRGNPKKITPDWLARDLNRCYLKTRKPGGAEKVLKILHAEDYPGKDELIAHDREIAAAGISGKLVRELRKPGYGAIPPRRDIDRALLAILPTREDYMRSVEEEDRIARQYIEDNGSLLAWVEERASKQKNKQRAMHYALLKRITCDLSPLPDLNEASRAANEAFAERLYSG